MGAPKYHDELEDLLSAALLEHGQRTKRNRLAAGSMYVPTWKREKFTDPANWVAKGQIQLVHRESGTVGGALVETLVGLFDEWTHVSARDARKLVAATRRPEVEMKIEYVTGDSWLGKAMEVKRQAPDRRIQLCEDVVLDMGVSAPAVILEVSLVGGGIARAALAQATRFEGFTPRTIVSLPAGLDILEGCTRSTKERLWGETKRILGMKEEE